MAQEYWIDTPRGQIFASRWQPQGRPGRGVPIILLHDSLGCVALWRDFPARLSRASGRDVVAYDRLGFGRSAPYPGRLPLSFMADEADTTLAAVRDHLELRRFALFGHSVGGGMAVMAANRYSEACQALVTESALAFFEQRTLEGLHDARRTFAAPEQRERLRRYHGEKAEWVLSAWLDTWLSRDFSNWSLDAVLPGVTCPTLAIHGEDDEYGSIRHPQRIASLATGPAELKILPDCGHVPHRERQEEVICAVETFLSRG